MSEVQPVEVFISYAPADETQRARLEVHMSLLQRQGWIRTWHRGRVIAGQEVDTLVAARLEAARLLLLLVSANFLSSDDCYEKEMKRALERHARGVARVIPIIAEACDWAAGPFGHLDVLPEGGRPVKSWRVQSEAWANVALGIRAVAAELALPPALVGELRAEADSETDRSVGVQMDDLLSAHRAERSPDRPRLAQAPHRPESARAVAKRPSAPSSERLEARSPLRFLLDEHHESAYDEITRRFVRAAFQSHKDVPSRLQRVGTPPARQISREREVLACLEKIGPAGCVIYGQPGVGKTTLARHLAQELAPHYADMQIEIDLMGASLVPMSPEAVMVEVICALTGKRDISELRRDEPDLAVLYASTLKRRRVLLLLDDARDSAQVASLVPPSGSLLIVTSRVQLTIPGMQALPLDALASDDAVALVRLLSPRLDKAAGHKVSRLCAFLPLPICIAARTLTVDPLDPTECIERLQTLREGMEAVEAVHRWAIDRIDAPLRALWYMLSAFPADFGHEAAAAVGAMDPGAIWQALRMLVDRGLITWDETSNRFRMHDRSGEYARSHADGPLLHEAALHHAKHFWGRLHARQAGHELSRFCELEEANLDAAQAWAAASTEVDDMGATICCALPLVASWCWRGRHRGRRNRWLLSGLTAAMHLWGDKSAYARAFRSVEQHGDARDAPREFHEQVLASARKLGDSTVEYMAIDTFAGWCAEQKDWPRAFELRKEQLAIAHRLGDRERQARAQEQLDVCLRCRRAGSSNRGI